VEPVCVTIDCAEPEVLAAFWRAALGWESVRVSGDGCVAILASRGGGLYLEFVRVPEAKTVKNRVHLGCTVGALAGVDAELERLVGLGASVAWEEAFPPQVAARYRNIVLRDPEGNEFCLGAGDPAGV
jgi:predicted enzyme related to lactoylglutathione lyase